ncbi:hypothetical protein ANN_17689 [Periplaneta americana]|uniref:Uncharacterized protein n=1 Tax=Periplaneta americana TaxID=6978 RepID=A0ABQ8STM9_PERAM|nr:hypothetical protein ANN_17689 [Periplaneta americana]
MSPGSSTESYPAFAHIGLRENLRKNLNQVTCLDRESNPGHLVLRPNTLAVTPQTQHKYLSEESIQDLLIEPDLIKDDSSYDPDDNADNSKSDHQSEASECSNHHLEPPYDPETPHDEDLSINEKSSYHQCDPQEGNIRVIVCVDDSDEEFLPMQGAGMSESVLSDTTSMEGSVSSTISSSSSTSKSGSVATSPLNRRIVAAEIPQLTPPDYFFWGAAKPKVYQSSPITIDELKYAITNFFSSVTKETLNKVFENKVKQVGLCLQENGRHFQHLL